MTCCQGATASVNLILFKLVVIYSFVHVEVDVKLIVNLRLMKICHLHVALLALGICLQLFKCCVIFELQKDNGTTGTLTENVRLQAVEGRNQELSAFSEAVTK